ncbi:hypothetical protein ACFWF3_14775, partial [Nocardia sp. NPDC060220]|uniref:hypothetical protein n=1 Tax=Nocardia sp. NPDC060220 TaxID=3347076 RepID=UPI00365DFDB4
MGTYKVVGITKRASRAATAQWKPRRRAGWTIQADAKHVLPSIPTAAVRAAEDVAAADQRHPPWQSDGSTGRRRHGRRRHRRWLSGD